ncbi:transmembrane protein, putative [Medicago truncatula]|uniref:Transmembrane protein, putative n=1 Tax=Medicago truncatula TaxID=3880 RepID=A0A072VH06_MEDTR|nr:transmembrane protein, putative [Medicago truncatula]
MAPHPALLEEPLALATLPMSILYTLIKSLLGALLKTFLTVANANSSSSGAGCGAIFP